MTVANTIVYFSYLFALAWNPSYHRNPMIFMFSLHHFIQRNTRSCHAHFDSVQIIAPFVQAFMYCIPNSTRESVKPYEFKLRDIA